VRLVSKSEQAGSFYLLATGNLLPSPLRGLLRLSRLIFGYLVDTSDAMSSLSLGMAYRKRPATTRTCIHCHDPYEAVDRRRLYCSSSCKVQACKAKRRRRLAAKANAKTALMTTSPSTALGALAPMTSTGTIPSALSKEPTLQLRWSKSNATLLTLTSLAAQLTLRLGDAFVKSFTRPAATKPLLTDPLSWLPAAFVTHLPQRRELLLPLWSQARGCVELRYFGHTFFYQPVERCLLWEVMPEQYLVVLSPELIPQIAELTPYQLPQALPTQTQEYGYGAAYGFQADSFAQPQQLRPGSQLKDLG
jgi:hypothetical protein